MPQQMHATISVTASDDESDGKSRSRFRRRRRKLPPLRAWDGLLRWAARRLLRWWALPFLLAAAVLLYLEASRLGSGGTVGQAAHNASETELASNLNRLDPVTRLVGGVRQRCLKLLPSKDLQVLEFPQTSEVFPIRRVIYRSDPGDHTDNYTQYQHGEGPRFNSFTGLQTMQEREESFKANETTVVHCGFYNVDGGFKISDEDKAYMKTCEAVVSTCAFGGGDDLYQPIGMTDTSLKKVCYVAFWDEITRSAQEVAGKLIDGRHMIGKWRIVIVKDLPFSDQRLNGKIPKMLSHRLFPEARYSIWVDSKSQFRRDPLGVLEALLWSTHSVLAISEHGARSSVYDEGKAVVKKNKATPEEVEIQLNQYRLDGFADIKRFNGKKALSEASVIIREHTARTNLLMCTWFNEVVRFTSRDQLSFPYVLRRLNIPGINMFPVCTRKDLVNSMGHKRKVKPLVI